MENAKKGGEAIVENINFFFGSLAANPAQPQRSLSLCCTKYLLHILDTYCLFGVFIRSLAVHDGPSIRYLSPYSIY